MSRTSPDETSACPPPAPSLYRIARGITRRLRFFGFVLQNRRAREDRTGASPWRTRPLDGRVIDGGGGRRSIRPPRSTVSMSPPSMVSNSRSASAIFFSCSTFSRSVLLARLVAVHHDAPDLGVDGARRLLRVVRLMTHVAAEEHLLLLMAEGNRAHLLAHAPLAHHLAGEVGRLVDVVAGAGGHLPEDDLLGDAAAQADGDAVPASPSSS